MAAVASVARPGLRLVGSQNVRITKGVGRERDVGRTIIAAQKIDVDKLEAKDAQEIPADTRHPSRIQVLGLHTTLKHALELDGNRERKFHCVVVSIPFVRALVKGKPTDNISTEERIDPTHDQRIGNHHRHVILHHPHHPVHRTRVRQRVRGRLSLPIWILKEVSVLKPSRQGLAPLLKGPAGEDVVVVAEGDASDQAALLAHGRRVDFLGCRGEEDGGVVAEDAGEDHDDGDGDEDPVAVVCQLRTWSARIGEGKAYSSWGSLVRDWTGMSAMMDARTSQCRRCSGWKL